MICHASQNRASFEQRKWSQEFSETTCSFMMFVHVSFLVRCLLPGSLISYNTCMQVTQSFLFILLRLFMPSTSANQPELLTELTPGSLNLVMHLGLIPTSSVTKTRRDGPQQQVFVHNLSWAPSWGYCAADVEKPCGRSRFPSATWLQLVVLWWKPGKAVAISQKNT